jgi:hypothetical protein
MKHDEGIDAARSESESDADYYRRVAQAYQETAVARAERIAFLRQELDNAHEERDGYAENERRRTEELRECRAALTEGLQSYLEVAGEHVLPHVATLAKKGGLG